MAEAIDPNWEARLQELQAPAGVLFLEIPIIEDWDHPPTGGFWNDSHAQYFTVQSFR